MLQSIEHKPPLKMGSHFQKYLNEHYFQLYEKITQKVVSRTSQRSQHLHNYSIGSSNKLHCHKFNQQIHTL